MPELEALAQSTAVPIEIRGGLASKEGKANLLLQVLDHALCSCRSAPSHLPPSCNALVLLLISSTCRRTGRRPD